MADTRVTASLQTKGGKYYAVLNWRDSNGKRKQKWVGTGLDEKGNKRKAEAMLSAIIEAQKSNLQRITCDMLFADFLEKWLEAIKGSLSPNTYEIYTLGVKKSNCAIFSAERY